MLLNILAIEPCSIKDTPYYVYAVRTFNTEFYSHRGLFQSDLVSIKVKLDLLVRYSYEWENLTFCIAKNFDHETSGIYAFLVLLT